jgi:hypothetical protein
MNSGIVPVLLPPLPTGVVALIVEAAARMALLPRTPLEDGATSENTSSRHLDE